MDLYVSLFCFFCPFVCLFAGLLGFACVFVCLCVGGIVFFVLSFCFCVCALVCLCVLGVLGCLVVSVFRCFGVRCFACVLPLFLLAGWFVCSCCVACCLIHLFCWLPVSSVCLLACSCLCMGVSF